MGLKTIIISFFERTSVRGVPRIVRHEAWSLRILWLTGVLVLLGVAISQAVVIVNEYFTRPKVTLLKEESVIEAFKSPAGMKFPSITVCNLNPLASRELSDGASDPTILPMANYSAMVNAYLRHVPEPTPDQPDLANAINYLKSFRGYFEYIGTEKAISLGHRKQNLVAKCDVMFQAASTDRFKVPCDYDSGINLVASPEFFNCYTISVDLNGYKHDMGMPTGLSLILYLDDGEEPVQGLYEASNDNSQSTGVRVSLQTENSTSDLWYSAFDISPGSSTQIMTRYSTRSRLGRPYGDCLDTSNDHNIQLLDVDLKPLAYTSLGCINSCTMDMVVAKCGCRDPSLLVLSNPAYLTMNRCGDFSGHNISATLTSLTCAMVVKKVSIMVCATECQADCKEAKYTRNLAAAKWPKKSQHLSFYDQVIKGQEFDFRFREYGEVQELADNGNLTEAEQMLASIDLIEKSFVKISMYLEDMSIQLIQESPKVTLAAMFSQLGGVLNLYIGVSLVLIVEFLELFYHLAMAVCDRGEKKDGQGGATRVTSVKPSTG